MPRVGLPIPASRLPSPFRQRSTADLLRASSLATPLAFHPRPIEVVVYDLTSEHCCWEDLSSGRLGAGSGAKCRESRFPAQGRVRRSSQPPRFNDGRLPYPPTNGRRVAVSIRGAAPTAAGRNRRAKGATRRSSEPPSFNEAKCRAHRTRRALASWRRRAAQW